MKFSPIRKKTMCGISGSEDVFTEERLEARGGMIRKFDRFAGAHKEVASELISHPGKIRSVAEQFCIREEEILIKRELKFIDIADIWYQFATKRKKMLLDVV
jgi:hypothetical protein